MNGEQFYNEFKDALRALGLRWGDMELMDVKIMGTALRFTYDKRVFETEIGE
jgi:hypothetical protein